MGFVAILAGWLTTESGRQPYVAYGILRTDQALSPVSVATVATSLTLFVLVYCVLFSIGIYYIHRLIWNGPKGEAVKPIALPEGLPNRPLSVADRSTREASGREPHPAGQATQPLPHPSGPRSTPPPDPSGPPSQLPPQSPPGPEAKS